MRIDKVTIVNVKKYVKLSDNVLKGKYSFGDVRTRNKKDFGCMFNKAKNELIIIDIIAELILLDEFLPPKKNKKGKKN